ncbi:hypothetical protein GCM10026988_31980 [Vibrio panuliri]
MAILDIVDVLFILFMGVAEVVLDLRIAARFIEISEFRSLLHGTMRN